MNDKLKAIQENMRRWNTMRANSQALKDNFNEDQAITFNLSSSLLGQAGSAVNAYPGITSENEFIIYLISQFYDNSETQNIEDYISTCEVSIEQFPLPNDTDDLKPTEAIAMHDSWNQHRDIYVDQHVAKNTICQGLVIPGGDIVVGADYLAFLTLRDTDLMQGYSYEIDIVFISEETYTDTVAPSPPYGSGGLYLMAYLVG